MTSNKISFYHDDKLQFIEVDDCVCEGNKLVTIRQKWGRNPDDESEASISLDRGQCKELAEFLGFGGEKRS